MKVMIFTILLAVVGNLMVSAYNSFIQTAELRSFTKEAVARLDGRIQLLEQVDASIQRQITDVAKSTK